MPESVEKAFGLFAAGLSLPAEQLQAALEKSSRVNNWARQRLNSSGSFYGGSYRRGTALPQESLKFHLLLGAKHYFSCNENSTKMLFFLRKKLSEEFSPADVRAGGTVVRLSSPGALDLDLTPTIKTSRQGYLSPNGQGGWCRINPGKEETVFKKKEELSAGRFYKFVKIIKAWNLRAGHPFNVYFLELLVYYRVNDFVKPYAELVHSFLMSMRLFLPEFLNCPAAGEVISSGANSAAGQKVLDEAINLSSRALHEDNPAEAISLWRSLLGDSFGAGN
ncbi:hypothetical protein [Pelotomaculum propionicicum]|uniref:Uncharacterized protein n=1 Tax=Pelotomaculum propionicicum TaxID=258475 RepID=A0A4Y7RRD1_9FIRM|nr:hypothetical protein [Pelotomaculum propionicicum]TEB11564.1 hypothetical protein Pmgp_01582 [Pelotomaculum propionicicum]